VPTSSALRAIRDHRPPFASPSTDPIPVPDPATGPAAAEIAAAAAAARDAPRGAVRRAEAALRTPRGAGACAIAAGVLLALAVGLTTSTPSGVIDLAAEDAELQANGGNGSGRPGGTGDDLHGDVRLRLPDGQRDAISEVATVEAAVVPASLPPGCPADAVQVWTPAGPLTIGPGTGVPVSVAVSPDAPVACRGATVTVQGELVATGPGGRPVRLTATGSVVLSALGPPAREPVSPRR
jgi:hypothetical protein